MSSNNGNGEGAAAMILFIIAGSAIAVMALLLYALLLFGAFILTVLFVCGWTRPFTIGGLTVGPDEGRPFVWRGLAGAVLTPAFAVFCEIVFKVRVPSELWLHLVCGGYAVFSLGLLLMTAQAEAEAAAAPGRVIDHEPIPQLPPQAGFIPTRPATQSTDAAPATVDATRRRDFTFASWDDEAQPEERVRHVL